jgi:hypothetical protein
MPWISDNERRAADELIARVMREGLRTHPLRAPYNGIDVLTNVQIFLRLSSMSFDLDASRNIYNWVMNTGLDFFAIVDPDTAEDNEATRGPFSNRVVSQPRVFNDHFHVSITVEASSEIRVNYSACMVATIDLWNNPSVDIVWRWQRFLEDADAYAEFCFGGPRRIGAELPNPPPPQEQQITAARGRPDPAGEESIAFVATTSATSTFINMPRPSWSAVEDSVEESFARATQNIRRTRVNPTDVLRAGEPDPETGWRRRNRDREHSRVGDLNLWYGECFVKYKDRVAYVRDFYSVDDPAEETNLSVRLHFVGEGGRLEENYKRVSFNEALFDLTRPPAGWAMFKPYGDTFSAEFYRYQVGGYRRGACHRNLTARVMIHSDGTSGRAMGNLHAAAAQALFTQAYIPLEQGLREELPLFLVNPVLAVQKIKTGTKRIWFNDVAVASIDELKTKTVIRLDNKFKLLSKVISRMTGYETK